VRRGTQAHAQLACAERAFVQHGAQRAEELGRIPFTRIDHAAVKEQEWAARRMRGGPVITVLSALLERFLVVAVLDDDEALGGNVGVTAAILRRSTRRNENARHGSVQRPLLDPLEAAPGLRVGRVAVLGHGIAEVGYPRHAGEPAERAPDLVRGCNGIGAPDY